MTTKELVGKYKAWKCKGGKRSYVAVEIKATKEDAKRIANGVFKTKASQILVIRGFKKGDYIYKNIIDAPKGKIEQIWICEVI